MRNKLIFFIFTVSFSSVVMAAPEFTPPAVPKNLHVYNLNGNTYVDLVPYSCSGVRYYIDPNHIKYNTIISVLMTAQITNKEVVIRFEGCNSQNQGKLIGVYFK